MASQSTILTWMTFLPLLGAICVLILPKGKASLSKYVALVASAIPLALSVQVFAGFDRSLVANADALRAAAPSLEYAAYGLQYVHHVRWIEGFNVEYFVGVDGISVAMVLLNAIISFIAVLASFRVAKPVDSHGGQSGITMGERPYYALLLLLCTGMMGVFVALDLFLFFVFWEVMLLPMYFLIGVWGGPRKEYAAIKFFLFTLVGSLAMLVAFLFIYLSSTSVGGPFLLADGSASVGGRTFNVMYLSFHADTSWTELFTARVAWMLLFVGFAIKVPTFPFHTWLPDAHVEAPTPISVILAGILLKMGGYGMLRFCWQMLPEATASFGTFAAVVGLIGILWGAYCAMAQRDFKSLVAYSSVSHMGFVLLGMASFTDEGMAGAVFQMFSHGLTTGMLFLLVGVVYDRAHHRNLDGFGGLARVAPVYTGFIGIAFMASLGLPGLSGFIGEVLVFIGAFQRYRFITILAVTSVIVTAGYMLWTLQRVFLGPVNEKYKDIPDLNWREWATLFPLAVPVVLFGVYPAPILDLFSKGLGALNQLVLSTL